MTVVREGRQGDPLVLAVGPTLDPVLDATADLATTIAYLSTVAPFPAAAVNDLAPGSEVAIVEPYLAGTSAAALADALRDEPRRLLALGVPPIELRRYGTPEQHSRAHGLDAAGIRRSLDGFLPTRPRCLVTHRPATVDQHGVARDQRGRGRARNTTAPATSIGSPTRCRPAIRSPHRLGTPGHPAPEPCQA